MATRKKLKKPAKPKKAARRKSAPKKKLAWRVPRKKASPKKPSRRKNDATATVFQPPAPRARSGGQSGNLQGLSGAALADSESVDELLEEGNTFEAEVVKGVQDVTDESEVVTHEVPEDDVPEEYLDRDK